MGQRDKGTKGQRDKGTKGQRETAEMQYQKIKLQEDYQTAHVVFTHGLCAVFAICLMTRACVGLESAETILTNPGPHVLEGICSDTEDVGEIEAECKASGVSGGEK